MVSICRFSRVNWRVRMTLTASRTGSTRSSCTEARNRRQRTRMKVVLQGSSRSVDAADDLEVLQNPLIVTTHHTIVTQISQIKSCIEETTIFPVIIIQYIFHQSHCTNSCTQLTGIYEYTHIYRQLRVQSVQNN